MSLQREVDNLNQRYEGRTRDRDQGISRNIDHFMEELRREQEIQDKRAAELEKRRNDLRSQLQNTQAENGAMILDDTEGAGKDDEEDWEEEYVVLDLDDVFHGAPVPHFAYTLSGLDTLNPILTLDNGLKLIGQYMETIGTVVVYSEKEKDMFEAQADTRELPTPADLYAVNNGRKSLKRIRGVCKLERKLKFCAMPIEDASAKNGVSMESALVKNAMLAEDTSLINAMPVEDASLVNDMPMEDASLIKDASTEDASLENARPTEDVPLDNATTTKDSSVENATPREDTSLENARPTEDVPLENTTTTKDASVENATPREDASLEIAKPTEDALLENSTPTEDASPENATPREDERLENATTTEDASPENAMVTEDASLEIVKPTEDASLENARPTEDVSFENATPTEDTSK